DYYMKISSALKKNADTLIYFINNIEYFANKLSKVLPEFHNLKVLILNVVTDFLEYHLKTSRFQHLEVLQIDYITINTVNCLIRNSGGRLKLIFICEPEIFYHDESLTFIRTVRENCSLIEYLSPVFITSDDHIIELEHLLMTCQKLKLLILAKYNNYYLDEDITYEKRMMALGEKILNVLINSAPISLN
ncbi:8979_t:CDS:1, partial [Funneliformis mosseae]